MSKLFNKLISIKYLGNFLIVSAWLLKSIFYLSGITVVLLFPAFLLQVVFNFNNDLSNILMISFYCCYGIWCLFSIIDFFSDYHKGVFGFLSWSNEFIGNKSFNIKDRKLSSLVITFTIPYWILFIGLGRIFKEVIDRSEKQRKEAVKIIQAIKEEDKSNKDKIGGLSKYE